MTCATFTVPIPMKLRKFINALITLIFIALYVTVHNLGFYLFIAIVLLSPLIVSDYTIGETVRTFKRSQRIKSGDRESG